MNNSAESTIAHKLCTSSNTVLTIRAGAIAVNCEAIASKLSDNWG